MFFSEYSGLLIIILILTIIFLSFSLYNTIKEKKEYKKSEITYKKEIEQLKEENEVLTKKTRNSTAEIRTLSLRHEYEIEELQELYTKQTDAFNSKTEKLNQLITKTDYLKQIYPILAQFFSDNYNEESVILPPTLFDDFSEQQLTFNNILVCFEKNKRNYYFQTYYGEQLLKEKYKILKDIRENSTSHKKIIPYMAQIIADIETISLEKLAESLDWGKSQERAHKVKTIRAIRKDAQEMIEKNMEAKYQLAYLLNLFPNLEDVIECEFQQLPPIDIDAVSDYDRTRDFLSKEEYAKLSISERNQLALDRYIHSHNKTKWQIGRDYELYVGYLYSKKGYAVDYFGSYMGLEDLGRDLICSKDNRILIIQCKYWSKNKQIHEKHITQLYGTLISYCIEHNMTQEKVKGLLITNTKCSYMAKKMADFLSITIVEDVELKEYPRIKCNIGHDESGNVSKIYHLPFDQQYDSTKITEKGEFFALTVKEAEEAGFRRAHKWFNI